MKLETHCHTSGISVCADRPFGRVVEVYRAAGYDGLVLTNHYNAHTLRRLGDTLEAQVERYIDEVRRAAAVDKKFRVLFGAEVAITVPSGWAEFLLFGLTPDVLRAHPALYDMSQKQLFDVCEKNGVVMVQSHPFRVEQGHEPQDPAYMHGLEINCHPGFLRNRDKVNEFAARHGLLVTCGSDYHGSHFKPYGGIEVDATDESSLAQALKAGAFTVFEQ